MAVVINNSEDKNSNSDTGNEPETAEQVTNESMEEEKESTDPEVLVPAKMLHNFIPIHPNDMEQIYGRQLSGEEIKILQANWERGFTLLSDSQKKEFGLEDASTYSSRQSVSRLLNCSPTSITDYVEFLSPLTPQGYLIDAKGRYTAECAHEILVYAKFAKRKLPSGEQNPFLFLKDSYLQSLEERAQIYKSWYLDRMSTSEEEITSLAVIPSATITIVEVLDSARQAEQVCAEAVLGLLPNMWKSLEATVIRQATEIRAKAYGVASDVIKNPKSNEISEEHNNGNEPSGSV